MRSLPFPILAAVVLKPVLQAVPVLCGVIFITFLLANHPGAAGGADGVGAGLAGQGLLGLPLRLWHYLYAVGRGDLGFSPAADEPVHDALLQRLPATVELALVALLIAGAIGVPLGIWAARRSWASGFCRALGVAGSAVPGFVMALALAALFGGLLAQHLPPPAARLAPWDPASQQPWSLIHALVLGDGPMIAAAARRLLLPALALSFTLLPLMLGLGQVLVAVWRSDAVRTARANGLLPHQVLWHYAMRSAAPPLLATLGAAVNMSLGGALVLEVVFAWPGMGQFAIAALRQHDDAPLQGAVLLLGLMYVLIHLVLDILRMLVDPRLRAAR